MPAVEIFLSFLITWTIGLAPALIVRFAVKRRPISKDSAGIISVVWCFLMYLVFRILTAAFPPESGPATHGAVWIAVFFVSRWIMSKGAPTPIKVPKPTPNPRLSREEMMDRLRTMISDPSTEDRQRAWATDRLAAFEKRIEP